MSDEYVDVPVSEDTRRKLDEIRRKKPDESMETDNEIVTRLLDNLEESQKCVLFNGCQYSEESCSTCMDDGEALANCDIRRKGMLKKVDCEKL